MALIKLLFLGGLILQGCDSHRVGLVKGADFRETEMPKSFDLQAGHREHQITDGVKTLFFSRERIHGDAGAYIRKATIEIDVDGTCKASTLRATMYPEDVATATSFFRIDSLLWIRCWLKNERIVFGYRARMRPLGTLLQPLIDTFQFEGKPPLKKVGDLSKWEGAVSDSLWEGAFPD